VGFVSDFHSKRGNLEVLDVSRVLEVRGEILHKTQRVRVAHGRDEGHPRLKVEAKSPRLSKEDEQGGEREERAGQIDVELALWCYFASCYFSINMHLTIIKQCTSFRTVRVNILLVIIILVLSQYPQNPVNSD